MEDKSNINNRSGQKLIDADADTVIQSIDDPMNLGNTSVV